MNTGHAGTMYHCIGFHRMECASSNQNDFIAKCSERETLGGIRGMRGGPAKVRLGLAHHLHQIEYAVIVAAPALHLMHFPICICLTMTITKKIN